MNRTLKPILMIFFPPVFVVAALLVQPWVDPRWAFPDPVVAAQSSGECCSAYFGIVSNLGVVYWCVAATACAAAAIVLGNIGAPARHVAFMAFGAALSAVLGLDDLLLLHERILPKLGLPQNLVLMFYASAGLIYAAVFFRELRQRDFAIFAAGILALGASLGIDFLVHEQSDGLKVAEDVAKFIGIAGWAGFHWRRATHAMTGAVSRGAG